MATRSNLNLQVQFGKKLNIHFRLLLLMTLFILPIYSWSQTYPVQANLFITPPYSVYLSDYTAVGSTRLNLNIFLADLSRPDLDVRFRLKIEGSGIELKTRSEYVGSRLNVLSGMPRQIYGDELVEYFNLQNLEIQGLSRSQLERTGALPEGIYRFTLEVLEYNRGVQISNSAASTAWLILNDPPIINLPLDSDIVPATEPQTVRFQWTPRHKGSPNASFSTEYGFKIVEIWPENRNPNDAMKTTTPIFETVTSNNYFVYGLAEPPLIPGRRYAFQIQARAIAGIDQLDLFKNNGNSVVRSFTFGESCNPPSNLSVDNSGNSYIGLKWEPATNNSAFTVMYQEHTVNSNWFDKFSYLPSTRLNQLKPGTNYNVTVQAKCGTLESEESEPIIVSTTNSQGDFVCGNIDFIANLSNRISIDSLKINDQIYAGDFKISLDSIFRLGGKYSGTGIASFPFLNFVKAKVRFNDVLINTEYKMFAGVVNTVYNPHSSMMYDLDDNTLLPDADAPPDHGQNEDGNEANEEHNPDPTNTGSSTQPASVDSVFTNEAGEVIIVIDGEETVAELPAEGDELDLVDNEGNKISVDSAGNITSSGTSDPTASPGSTVNPVDNRHRFTFGPLMVEIIESEDPQIEENKCTFKNLEASVELTLEDINKPITKSLNLASANFSYTKDCDTDEILYANLTWQNEEGKDIGNIYDFNAKVFSLSLEIDRNGSIEGKVDMIAALKVDKQLTDLAILRAGVSGGFKYEFNKEGEGFVGRFDFDGVENINLDLVKQNKVIGSLQNGSLDSDGILTGKIRLVQEMDYQSSQFSIRVKKLNFDIEYGINQDFNIQTGQASLIISQIELLDGELRVNVNIEDNNISTVVEGSDLEAFGMVFSDLNLDLNLDTSLNLRSISGSLIATHPDFGIGLNVDEFMVKNGSIEILNMAGEVDYRDVHVVIQEARLDDETNALLLNAFVQVEGEGISIAAEVEDFSVDEKGAISWGGFDVNFDGVRTFGPLTIAISAESGESSGTWRAKTAKASLTLDLDDALEEPLIITDATISYLKHKSKNRYKDIKITIDDVQLAAPAIGPLQAKLTNLNLEILTENTYLTGKASDDAEIKLSSNSYVAFSVGLDNDVELGQLLVIQSGVTGEVKYNFNGQGLLGNFDYQGVENLNVLARTAESTIASLTHGVIEQNGILTGTVTALPGATFNSGGFSVAVEDLLFNVTIPFTGDLRLSRINSGRGKLNLTNIGNLEGSLSVDLEIDEASNISAQILNSSEISAFGMELSSFDLRVDLQDDLQITSIIGQLEAFHPEFDAALKVSEFRIIAGKLDTFNFEGKVAYKGFNLDLQKVDYRQNTLVVDGKVAINITGAAAWMAVDDLSIAPDGQVTIRGVEGELDKSPVYIAFSASMDDSRLSGSFSGDLSGIGLEGKIDIGVENEDYNFAYLELTANGNIPLAGSGIKLTKLGGQFGYNYALKYEQVGQPPTGSPQEGNYVVGLTLGLADMANMIEVTGNSVVQFGNENFDLQLSGSVSIPKQNTIATGTMDVHYALPSNTLDGSLDVDVVVPPKSGKLLNGNFDMAYAMSEKAWSVSSTNISAKIFSEIDFTGNISLAGSANGDNFSGALSGYSSYEFSTKNEFEAFGASLMAELDAGFNFQGTIKFDETGAEGDVMLSLYANGELGIETLIGGYNKLIGLNGTSLANLSFSRETALVAGQMEVAVFFLGFEHNVDIAIEKRI